MEYLPKFSRTKIIATLGPASSSEAMLKSLFLAGVDVCRLNFSHGSYEEHLNNIKLIRHVSNLLNMNIAIMADLQGPKLRIGEVEPGTVLIEGSEIEFTNEKMVGNAQRVYMSYKDFPKDVKPNEFVLVDDGKIKLQVTETNGIDMVKMRVVYGGKLSSKKGVNLPDTAISQPSLTPKDAADAEFALENGVDWLALSFVRAATDIIELKELIKRKKKKALVIAKIEKPEALTEIDNIIDVTDAIMVARGDLGVEVEFEKVPNIQKELVAKCMHASKPVIIATQMMESMITAFRPTRAEATDVANAVLDGADALMLSGETSVGQFPLEVIQSMQKIIDYTENRNYHFYIENPPKLFTTSFIPDSICYNASQMAKQTQAKAIVLFTHSGVTAFKMAGLRPEAPIYAFTDNEDLLPKLALVWGVKAFFHEREESIEEFIKFSIDFLVSKNCIHDDDIVIHIAGIPLIKGGRTNMMRITYV